MIGYKVYYEEPTGDVILTIPEKHNENAKPTTKEQDFSMYDVLQARKPESVDFIQLDYGQHRGDFQIANSWKINMETKQIVFEYPRFETPLTEQVRKLAEENERLKAENELLKQSQFDQDEAIFELAEILALGGINNG